MICFMPLHTVQWLRWLRWGQSWAVLLKLYDNRDNIKVVIHNLVPRTFFLGLGVGRARALVSAGHRAGHVPT